MDIPAIKRTGWIILMVVIAFMALMQARLTGVELHQHGFFYLTKSGK